MAACPAMADVAASCKRSNGCGPGNAPGLVRDTWGSIDFRTACDHHDACYATQGKTKDTCDRAFLGDMQAACRDTFSEDGIVRRSCYGLANDYFAAVWAAAGGAYDNAQACLDDALAREKAGIHAFIIELRSRSRHRRERGEHATAAAAAVKQRPAAMRLAIDDDMAGLRASTNEIALYKVMLANATPTENTPVAIAAHRAQVARVQEVVDELTALHAETRAAVDRELARFDRNAFEAHATTLATTLANRRFGDVDAKLDEASQALAAARTTNVGIGQHAPPDQAQLARAARLMWGADTMLDNVVGHVQRVLLDALAADLRPLTTAQTISRRALARSVPIYARGRNLVGRPLFTVDTRPPPPSR